MRRALLSILLALVPGLLCHGQEPYFCTTPGAVLRYDRCKVGSTKVVQSTCFEVDSVVPTPGGRRIHYATTVFGKSGRPLYGGRAPLVMDVTEEGDAMVDFAASVSAFAHNLFPGVKVKRTGTPGLLPACIQPGDTLPSAHCVASAGPIKYTIEVTGRRALRRERITTPAGTFDCIVVRERKIERSPVRSRNGWMDNYYVKGMGYVRHDTYDADMVPLESEVLVSMEGF